MKFRNRCITHCFARPPLSRSPRFASDQMNNNKPSGENIFIIFPSFVGTATTRRVRSDRVGGNGGAGGPSDSKNTKRRQSTTTRRRHSSLRRGSQYHEVHIAMLPDLSGKYAIADQLISRKIDNSTTF